MKRLFGYIRVSTTKQAEIGVSLTEQRDAIQAFADKQGYEIVAWYEERITAAKRGRPVFSAMLKALKSGKAEGIAIHKIDRSARNLGDWADLGELIDSGLDIYFAHEPLDLHSRGGRLSADILAVVAADFIRNNRQEARKGFYGRLKQGIYPMGAPLGYCDNGKGGKLKTLDTLRAPLVRYAFEQYATGEVSLLALLDDLARKGLRNRRQKPLTFTGLVSILRNPFYAGIIRLKKTGETFPAKHEPLIRMATFESVQDVMDGRKPRRVQVHDYLYRRLFSCATCGRSLIGSRAKGRVYYRCSVRTCPTTSIREDVLDAAVSAVMQNVTLPDEEIAACKTAIEEAVTADVETREASRAQLTGRLGDLTARLNRLTDVYLDGGIDKVVHDDRRAQLILERAQVNDLLAHQDDDALRRKDILLRCVELARSPETLYQSATKEGKRTLLGLITSNRKVAGKNIEIATAEPFCFLPSAQANDSCAHNRVRHRTIAERRTALCATLLDWAKQNPVRWQTLLSILPELPEAA
ncbi:MAG TPA: recombinase family protein [Thermoanaerobaculia bacterium]|jgi:DNA invertase Pin-like site-specific DNA recombinase|nr:recombinase family protein [Thermoanaerobaculia bacterium]